MPTQANFLSTNLHKLKDGTHDVCNKRRKSPLARFSTLPKNERVCVSQIHCARFWYSIKYHVETVKRDFFNSGVDVTNGSAGGILCISDDEQKVILWDRQGASDGAPSASHTTAYKSGFGILVQKHSRSSSEIKFCKSLKFNLALIAYLSRHINYF